MPLIEPKRRRFGLFFLIINFGIKKKKKKLRVNSLRDSRIYMRLLRIYVHVCVYVCEFREVTEQERSRIADEQSEQEEENQF